MKSSIVTNIFVAAAVLWSDGHALKINNKKKKLSGVATTMAPFTPVAIPTDDDGNLITFNGASMGETLPGGGPDAKPARRVGGKKQQSTNAPGDAYVPLSGGHHAHGMRKNKINLTGN